MITLVYILSTETASSVWTKKINMTLEEFLNTYVKKVYRERYANQIINGNSTPNYSATTWKEFINSFDNNMFSCVDFNNKSRKDGITPASFITADLATIHLSDNEDTFNKVFKDGKIEYLDMHDNAEPSHIDNGRYWKNWKYDGF